MAEGYLRQSALAHLGLAARAGAGPEDAGVVLGERPLRGQLALRGRVRRKTFRDAVAGALGVVPPRAANTVASAGGVDCLWLGPDEWLVVCPEERRAALLVALGEALAGLPAAVADVSEGRSVLALAGPRARDVLAKGCPLDLHPRAFAPGRCAQSGLAGVPVILHQLDAAPRYRLHVQRSMAVHLWTWLEDAAAEYGLAITGG